MGTRLNTCVVLRLRISKEICIYSTAADMCVVKVYCSIPRYLLHSLPFMLPGRYLSSPEICFITSLYLAW